MLHKTLFVTIITLLACAQLDAQPGRGRGGGDRGGRGGGGPGGFGGRGGDSSGRSEGFLQMMDANKDGVIQANEINDRNRFFAERILERAGVEAKYPIAISKVREALEKSRANEGGGGPGGGSPWGGPGGQMGPWGQPGGSPGPQNGGRSAQDSNNRNAGSAGSVPGFGAQPKPAAIQGFGDAPKPNASASERKDERPNERERRPDSPRGQGDGNRAPSPPSQGLDARLREQARGMIKMYDKNGNGKLEGDELQELKPRRREADTNGDGTITEEELAANLGDFAGGSVSGRPGPPASGSARSSEANSGDGSNGSSSAARKSYRLRTAAERLPPGLPSWFSELDADGDGQVSMAEYATTWTAAKAKEFVGYDLNNDGIVTAREAISKR